MKWKFNVSKLIEDYSFDTVVNEFRISSGLIAYYRNGGTPKVKTLLKVEARSNVDLTKYLEFKNVRTIGDRIRMYRILGYFTVAELADEMQVTPYNVRCWENNLYVPNEKHAEQLSQLFQIDVDALKGCEWKVQREIEMLNAKIVHRMHEWTVSKNTSDSLALDEAQEMLNEMRLLGIKRDIILGKDNETSGEEYVY